MTRPASTVMAEIDIFASSTVHFNIIILDYMKKNVAFAGNTGHFCNEIVLAGSEGLEGMAVLIIKPQKTVSSSPSAAV